MEKAIQKFVKYLKAKKIPLSKADIELGVGNGYIGKQLKANGSMNSDVLELILKKYYDLNPIWLLTDKLDEEMLLDDAKATDNMANQSNKIVIEMQKKIIAGKDAEIQWHKHRIDKLQKQVISLGHKPVESD